MLLMMEYDLVEKIGQLLAEKGKTLALAESCTGGYISSLITDVPGSSLYFKGGVVSYSNGVKRGLLKVTPSVIKDKGAVSSEVAEAMAEGIRIRTGSDIAASITGIAGPSGGTADKPVGSAYIGFSDGSENRTEKIYYTGTRTEIKEKFAKAVLEFIINNI